MSREEKIKELLLRDEIERRKYEKSYYEFFKQAWKVQEPETDLEDNWHIEYLCNTFQKVVENVANRVPQKDVIVNISPRSTKSKIISINLAPWIWIKYPWLKIINSSHSSQLSTEHSVKSRWLIESDWYQYHWGKRFSMASDQNVKTYYANDKGGCRISVSVGQKVAGRGGDIIIADDILDPEEADSEISRQDANSHYSSGLYTRLNNKKTGVRILVMQRMHEDDPTGAELAKRKDKYNFICIPAEETDAVSPPELRTYYKNGLYDPLRFDREVLEEAKTNIGSLKYAGQFLQSPMSLGGNIFKSEWWRFYDELPKIIDKWIQSWDLTFDEGDDKAYVVGQVWAKKDHNLYLVYEFRKQIGFNDQVRAFVATTTMFPKTYKKLVEKKANGAALIDYLKSKIPGIDPIEPHGSKEARAISVSPIIESGLVYLPNKEKHSWVVDFINECAKFPNGTYADRIDAMSQAIDHFYGSASFRLKNLLADL